MSKGSSDSSKDSNTHSDDHINSHSQSPNTGNKTNNDSPNTPTKSSHDEAQSKQEDSALKFYMTPSHPCSYFDDREAQTIFVDPKRQVNSQEFLLLTENGFRRSGNYIYRPNCKNCIACESLRIPVRRFNITKKYRRIVNKNKDLSSTIKDNSFNKKHYQLYERYINERHKDGDMYPASEEQYRSFLLAPFNSVRFIEYTLDDQLVAVSVIDELPMAISAIYTFFEPKLSARSLGVYVILKQIELCLKKGLPYLYLGYYIQNSPKMHYKNQFKPHQIFQNHQWLDISATD